MAFPKAARCRELAYVRLSGGVQPGELRTIEFDGSNADAQADEALAELTKLLQEFSNPETPYYSLVHPMWTTRYGTYDHLARVKEWSLTAGVDDNDISRRRRMSAPREIPPAVTARQIEASDPHHSAFVAANAGSGKTHVLAQRVIRLLLSGVDPARILCITFTKAAAANMANRVFDELRKWTRLDDADLDKAMQAAGVGSAHPQRSARRARQLFALALETPGGLKVRTIHAFCTQLLHLFPFEANVAARFEVLDEATEAQLLEQLSLGVMLQAAAEPDSPLGQALAAAVLAAADVTFRELVRETIRKRDVLVPWVEAAGGVPQAMRELSQALGIQPEETMREIDAMFFNDSVISASEWPAIAAAFSQGSTDRQGSGRAVRGAGQALRHGPAGGLFRYLLHRQTGKETRPARDQGPSRSTNRTCARG